MGYAHALGMVLLQLLTGREGAQVGGWAFTPSRVCVLGVCRMGVERRCMRWAWCFGSCWTGQEGTRVGERITELLGLAHTLAPCNLAPWT